MPFDKWLQLLKASGWKTAALAFACWILWKLINSGELFIPPAEAWLVKLPVAVIGIGCACLAIASMVSSSHKAFPIDRWIRRWWVARKLKKDIEKYIPHMTEKDREIVGCLLSKNQKFFTCDITGGHATTLISAGVVIRAVRPGQAFDQDDVPFAVADEAWEVLIKHKDHFPYEDSKNKPYPWRVGWMS
jgi:hypothetical protein